ncbi:MAG: Crp/Fnr family transcriptional regulator [Pigmentiphaga sp.]
MPAISPTPTSRELNQQFAAALREVMSVAAFELRHHFAGQRVLSADLVPTALPLVESGALQAVTWLPEGEPQALPVSYEPGELALSSQLFAATPANIDIVCATDSVLRWLPQPAIEAALREHPTILAMLAHFLAQRIREVQVRERIWLERGASERIWANLLQTATQSGVACGWGVRLTLTHDQLASRCGVSRPKLSRELKRLEAAGLVRLGRGWLDVRDVAASLPAPDTPGYRWRD